MWPKHTHRPPPHPITPPSPLRLLSGSVNTYSHRTAQFSGHTHTHSHTHTHTHTHTHSLTHTLTHLCRHMPYRHNATHAQYPRTQIHICTRENAEHGCLFLIHAGTLRGLARTPRRHRQAGRHATQT